jgi:hypothetical protein
MRPENHISNELKELNLALPWVNQPSMGIPDGYFEHFPQTVLTELKSQDFWASMPKSMPQDVSNSFFTENQEQISTQIFLSQLPKENVGAVPEAYFQEFESQLATSLFIDQLPKSNPQAIPNQYFDQFLVNLMNQREFKSNASPTLHVRSTRLRILSMAASIALFIGIGFSFLSQPKSLSVEHQIATLSTSEIENYIQQHQTEFDIDLSVDYIDPNQVDLPRLEDEVLNNPINQLSQDEIDEFLL